MVVSFELELGCAVRRRRSPLGRIAKTIGIGDSDLVASPHGLRWLLSSEDAAEDLYELPIAVRLLPEARAIADNGFRRLACQSWARSALIRAVAARLPTSRQAC